MPIFFDFHTHDILAENAIISLPVSRWGERKTGENRHFSLELHPWEKNPDLDKFAELAESAEFIGEIGLDKVHTEVDFST